MQQNRLFYILLWIFAALAVLAIAFNGQIARDVPFLRLPITEHLPR